MFCTIAIDKFWREKSRNRGYKLGDLKDEVTKPSIEDHLDGPDLGMVVQDGHRWSSVNWTKGTNKLPLKVADCFRVLTQWKNKCFSVEEQVQVPLPGDSLCLICLRSDKSSLAEVPTLTVTGLAVILVRRWLVLVDHIDIYIYGSYGNYDVSRCNMCLYNFVPIIVVT